MDSNPSNHRHRRRAGLWWLLTLAAGFTLWCVLLIEEHAAHLTAIAPWLILLLCPLMHLFMHHDHGRGGGHGEPDKDHDHGA